MVINPGPLRTRMRAALMPGEDPLTLKTPEDFAPACVTLCRPAWTETGSIYNFPTGELLRYQAPGL